MGFSCSSSPLVYEVGIKEEGLSLLQYLKGIASGKQVKRAIENAACIVNGHIERFASYKVKRGDHILFHLDRVIKTHSHKPKTLFEDEDLMVIDKPAGISSELLATKEELAHRLDKWTTGVMLLAKNAAFQMHLEELFRQREVDKTYIGLIDGVPDQTSGIIKNLYGIKKSYSGQKIWGSVPKGRPAETSWKILKRYGGYSLIECKPKTGRTHQIRSHLCEMGHPILGDYQYCRKFHSNIYPHRYLLHAKKISFEGRTFEASTPQDFNQVGS